MKHPPPSSFLQGMKHLSPNLTHVGWVGFYTCYRLGWFHILSKKTMKVKTRNLKKRRAIKSQNLPTPFATA